MSLGYRVFFVHDGKVNKISQKRFNSLYLKNAEALPKFAGQTVVSVLVVYELVARKPDRIIRMDTQKIRFNGIGFVDKAYENEGLQLVASRMDDVFGSLGICNDMETSSQEAKGKGSIVDASKRFDERRWDQRHPELSGRILKKVMAGVFGTSA